MLVMKSEIFEPSMPWVRRKWATGRHPTTHEGRISTSCKLLHSRAPVFNLRSLRDSCLLGLYESSHFIKLPSRGTIIFWCWYEGIQTFRASWCLSSAPYSNRRPRILEFLLMAASASGVRLMETFSSSLGSMRRLGLAPRFKSICTAS